MSVTGVDGDGRPRRRRAVRRRAAARLAGHLPGAGDRRPAARRADHATSTCATRSRSSTWSATSPTSTASRSASSCTTSTRPPPWPTTSCSCAAGRRARGRRAARGAHRRGAHRDVRHPRRRRAATSAPAACTPDPSAGTRTARARREPADALSVTTAEAADPPARPSNRGHPAHVARGRRDRRLGPAAPRAAPPRTPRTRRPPSRRRRRSRSRSRTTAARVTLDAPATKVVSLEWGLTENLLTLGVMAPVGAADVEGLQHLGHDRRRSTRRRPTSAQRGEPSLDAIAALDPDLVVTTTDLPPEVITQIEEEYPVIALRGSDAADPIGHMRRTVTILGEATGTSDKAEAALADFDAAGRRRQGEARGRRRGRCRVHHGRRLDLRRAAVSIRMYTPGSFLGGVADAARPGERLDRRGRPRLRPRADRRRGPDRRWATSTSSTSPATTDGGDAFKDGLAGNAIWEQLPFVVAGNVHRLPDGIWMFGGPLSAEPFVDAAVKISPRDPDGRAGRGGHRPGVRRPGARGSAARRRAPRRWRWPRRWSSAPSTSPRAPRRWPPRDLLRLLILDADPLTVDVLVASRLPRVLACVSSVSPWGWPARPCSRWPATRWPRRTRSPSTPARTSRSWPSRPSGSRCLR